VMMRAFVKSMKKAPTSGTTSGYIGFGLGITPNAVANMEALTRAYHPAPRSFLVVPLVGAFFIDFTNALIITVFLNFVS